MKNDIGNYKNTYIDTEIDKILASLDDRSFEKFLSGRNVNACKKHKENITKHLTKSRYEHTIRVSHMASALALAYEANEENAIIASYYHDIQKEKSKTEHGRFAAEYASENYGITDKDVLGAITHHTMGRPAMTLLEKIVFIADSIELGREYEGVTDIRKLAFYDIDMAVYLYYKYLFKKLKNEGAKIGQASLNAAEYYREFVISKFMANFMSEKIALDVKIAETCEKNVLADFAIIATGKNARHMDALTYHIKNESEKFDIKDDIRVEGRGSEWIIMDIGFLLINIFTNDKRSYYNLEKLWNVGFHGLNDRKDSVYE